MKRIVKGETTTGSRVRGKDKDKDPKDSGRQKWDKARTDVNC